WRRRLRAALHPPAPQIASARDNSHRDHRQRLRRIGSVSRPAPRTSRLRSLRIMNAMRQPVHVVYGGAHLFKSDTTRKLGALAERALAEYAPDVAAFAGALDIRDDLAATVYQRVVEKLRREPIEDYRIDFEDGFGIRSD